MSTAGSANTLASRGCPETIRLSAPDEPSLALYSQPSLKTRNNPDEISDVIYIHGATFGAALSVMYRFDGRSWADAINDAGFNVWGFDFIGYGKSDRYPDTGDRSRGSAEEALPQLRRVINEVRTRNGGKPIMLVAHSWGSIVAAQYTAENSSHIHRLALFGPIVKRPAPSVNAAKALPPLYPLSLWAQYRRFIEDVPRGQPQVLNEAHIQSWGAAYLDTDPHAASCSPPSVMVPSGPLEDIRTLWSGKALYNPAAITTPTLIVRGEWDSLCTDHDAQALLTSLGGQIKSDVKIEKATHLMHLEMQRTRLYDVVNKFLKGQINDCRNL
jgi:pimeloyl-ACP methyl ester carboxylesterase